MFLLRLAILITTIASVAACAVPRSSAPQVSTPPGHRNYATTKKARKAFDTWHVHCENSSFENCPNEVGEFLVINGQMLTLCTATLIGDQTAILSSHCLPAVDPKALQNLCDNSAIVFADESADGRAVARCGSIIAKSTLKPNDNTLPDYMILKLKKKMERGFLKISQTGMTDGQTLTVAKIDPVDFDDLKVEPSGLLKTTRCKVAQGSILLPFNSQADDAVQLLRGCDIVEGNSGSALRNSDDQITGLIHAGHDGLPAQGDKVIDATIAAAKIAVATNLACVDVSSITPDARSPRCGVPLTAAQKAKIKLNFGNRFQAQVSDQIQKDPLVKALDPRLGYGAAFNGGVLNYAPVCFKAMRTWLAPDIDGVMEKSDFAQLKLPNWKLRAGIDETLKPYEFVDSLPFTSEVVTFNPRDLDKKHVSVVKIKISAARGTEIIQADQTWTECPVDPNAG